MVAPNSAESIALIKRVIAVKMDYAREIARANDLTKATALHLHIAGHKSKSRLIFLNRWRHSVKLNRCGHLSLIARFTSTPTQFSAGNRKGLQLCLYV
jgi:hypothetical protein